MNYFDRKTTALILCFCLPLLFLPKINLISFGKSETAGIRVDDVVLLLLGTFVYWAHFALNKNWLDIEKWIVALVAFSLVSFGLNLLMNQLGLLHVHAVIFYAVRVYEYFLFFYLGLFTASLFNSQKVVRLFFGWNLLLLLLQKLEWIGQFTSVGYAPVASERIAGIASFPSEAGLFLSMLFAYFAFQRNAFGGVLRDTYWIGLLSRTYLYWLFLVFSVLIIWTGSRIAIVAILLPFLVRLKEEIWTGTAASFVLGLFFVSLLSISTVVVISYTESVFSRSAGLFSLRNLDLCWKVWDSVSLAYHPVGQESVRFESYDMSWWIRIHKWMYALKMYVSHPYCYLQGIGPGFGTAAIDGGFVRIISEYGIVGSFLYMKIFALISRKSEPLKWVVIVFLVNMIFFDAYLAYKPMSLLFFLTGCAYVGEAASTGRALRNATAEPFKI